jgi:hypothetical protein
MTDWARCVRRGLLSADLTVIPAALQQETSIDVFSRIRYACMVVCPSSFALLQRDIVPQPYLAGATESDDVAFSAQPFSRLHG